MASAGDSIDHPRLDASTVEARGAFAPRWDWAFLCAAAALSVAIAKFDKALIGPEITDATLIWVPAGLALVMFLRCGVAALPFAFAASAIVNVTITPIDTLAATGRCAVAIAADLSGPALGAALLRRRFPQGVDNARDLWRFWPYACLIPATISAAIHTTNLIAAGVFQPDERLERFSAILFADALGIFLIYSLYDLARSGVSIRPKRLTATHAAASVAIACPFLAHLVAPFFIALTPLAMIFVGMHGAPGVVAVANVAAVLALLIAAAIDLQPFIPLTELDGAVFLSVFAMATVHASLLAHFHAREINGLRRAQDDWRKRAETDSLTGALDRAPFFDAIAADNAAKRRGCLAVFDLDHFKAINDRYGHNAGDRALIAVVTTTRNALRGEDRVARLGGEEFGVFLPDCGLDDATRVIDALRRTLMDLTIIADEQRFKLTASFGLVALDPAITVDTLYRQADAALYAAKATGRNRAVVAGAA